MLVSRYDGASLRSGHGFHHNCKCVLGRETSDIRLRIPSCSFQGINFGNISPSYPFLEMNRLPIRSSLSQPLPIQTLTALVHISIIVSYCVFSTSVTMLPNDSKDDFQPTDVLTLTSKTDIKVTFPPDMTRPKQAVLLCTYYITIPENGPPKANDDVKFLVGDYKDMPQGEWKHTYNITHATVHHSDDMSSDGIVFPTAGWDGVASLGEDNLEAAADVLETVPGLAGIKACEEAAADTSTEGCMPLRPKMDGLDGVSLA